MLARENKLNGAYLSTTQNSKHEYRDNLFEKNNNTCSV
jgi:hypothetical protein